VGWVGKLRNVCLWRGLWNMCADVQVAGLNWVVVCGGVGVDQEAYAGYFCVHFITVVHKLLLQYALSVLKSMHTFHRTHRA